IVWAIAMIFLLPFVARLLELPAGIGGAWIGTSEFADAAGLAAAQSYGNLADNLPNIDGTSDQAVFAVTLMKVVRRDVWIGIWAFALAIVATTRWERGTTAPGSAAAQIWLRFPKFVFGFLIASLLVTAVVSGYTLAEYDARVTPSLIAPLRNLRTWAFIFCFLSIGLTTRFRELATSGIRPQVAFAAGALVNVLLGYVLSVWVFAERWRGLCPFAARAPPTRQSNDARPGRDGHTVRAPRRRSGQRAEALEREPLLRRQLVVERRDELRN